MENQTTAIIRQLAGLSTRLSSTSSDGETARSEALQLSKQLTASLERPENVAIDLLFSPLLSVAASVAVHLQLFKHILVHSGPVTSRELAFLSGGEELLIIRVLRPLAALGLVNEVGERTWTATPATKAMTIEGIAAGHRHFGRMVVAAAQRAPEYFKEAGYKCPTNPRDGLMQYAFQTKLTSFELYTTIPEVFQDFNLFMGATMGAKDYWADWFPIEQRLIQGYDMGSALLVDVGGGKGHDVLAFHSKFPNKGRLVLQDRAPVIQDIDINPAIECVAYDFFTEQPVKGARAYFYHHVLHDWSDSKCLEILEQVRNAMEPGYSKLLLHEMLVPEQGASAFYSMLDWTMMVFGAGMERTQQQWRELLNQAGFDVVEFWPAHEEGADGLIEASISK